MLLGSIAIYSALFAIGYGLYGKEWLSLTLLFVALLAGLLTGSNWRRLAGRQAGSA